MDAGLFVTEVSVERPCRSVTAAASASTTSTIHEASVRRGCRLQARASRSVVPMLRAFGFIVRFGSSRSYGRVRGVSTGSLSPVSYLVLGLVAKRGSATPYELKADVAKSIGYFWSFPHSQLYAEPARLARAGLLAEEREQGGRRRRTYSATHAGREALAAWLAEPTGEPP